MATPQFGTVGSYERSGSRASGVASMGVAAILRREGGGRQGPEIAQGPWGLSDPEDYAPDDVRRAPPKERAPADGSVLISAAFRASGWPPKRIGRMSVGMVPLALTTKNTPAPARVGTDT